MCAELLWWRCHRRIIADYLICRGEVVFHIIDRDTTVRAALNPRRAALVKAWSTGLEREASRVEDPLPKGAGLHRRQVL